MCSWRSTSTEPITEPWRKKTRNSRTGCGSVCEPDFGLEVSSFAGRILNFTRASCSRLKQQHAAEIFTNRFVQRWFWNSTVPDCWCSEGCGNYSQLSAVISLWWWFSWVWSHTVSGSEWHMEGVLGPVYTELAAEAEETWNTQWLSGYRKVCWLHAAQRNVFNFFVVHEQLMTPLCQRWRCE